MVEELKEELERTFKEVSARQAEEDRLVVTSGREQALAVLKFLRDKGLDHLALISCVDWPDDGELELVYILTSYLRGPEPTGEERVHVILKTRVPRDEPKFPTAVNIFRNAEPYEREIHEFFGVEFEGHPRPTHLILDRDYEVPPFRKDFDTRKYVEEFFDRVPFVEGEG